MYGNGNAERSKYGNYLSKPGKIALAFLLPALVVLFVVTIYPFIRLLLLSFQDFNMVRPAMRHFIALNNFARMIKDNEFLTALLNTIYFSGVSIAIELGLALLLSGLLMREAKLGHVVSTLLILPMMITPVATAYMWRIIYNPEMGIINYFISLFGIKPLLWLASPATAMPSMILVDVWMWTPFLTLILYSGLMSLPSEPFEAALVDGASAWQMFSRITFPLLGPVLITGVLLRTIDSLKTFDIIYTLTGGGPIQATETLNLFIYRIAFRFLQLGYSSAVAVVMIVLIVFICDRMIKYGSIEI